MSDQAKVRLTQLSVSGFKSIRELRDFELGDLNILIGANGAGKSNLISFFKLLGWMLPPPGQLQYFVSRFGGANALLYFGASRTPQLQAELTFRTERGDNQYAFRLFHAAGDTLVFAEERFRFHPEHLSGAATWSDLGAGHHEAQIIPRAEEGRRTAKTILHLLKQCVVYQFHNTSETARVRQKWDVTDNYFLKEDAANLAPVLLRLRETKPKYYARIVETLRQVAPFFADFQLDERSESIMLQWKERQSDVVFGAHQMSDGTVRLMALVTLLLLPTDERPNVILLDEPELGLHPLAIDVVAGLVHAAAQSSQIVVATQSPSFVNAFDPQDVVVVERQDSESVFRRLDPASLEDWLQEYSLAELWEKNVLGGKPG